MRVVLASGSPSRLALLRAAGVEPEVIVSAVDEEAIAAALGPDARPAVVVAALARAKAEAVAQRLLTNPGLGEPRVDETSGAPTNAAPPVGGRGEAQGHADPEILVIAADSAFLLNGTLHGKPHTPEVARARWREMSGNTGTLLTGHHILRIVDGSVAGTAAEVGEAAVRFGDLTGDDAEAYLATGEPLEVAGAFTLEGRGSWFIEGIEGDPATVIGLGMPVLRGLLGRVGLSVSALWRAGA